MKISPIAPGNGNQPHAGVDVGRTANPQKMERARAIARGEVPPEADKQVERLQNDSRRIKMRVNRSPERLDVDNELVEALSPALENNQEVTNPIDKTTPELPESSKTDTPDKGNVEAIQPLSPQFAALAKQKRALQLERAEFEKLKSSGPTELIERLKSQPLKVLQEHGVTYDQLTEAILNDGGVNPEIEELKKEIRALKEGVDKSFESREVQAEEAALTEMLFEAEGLAKEGETYEMIREQDAYDKVLKHIHSTYKATGRVLDVTVAMDKVEADLFKEAERLANLGKVKARIGQPAPTPLQPQQRQMKTLTARDSASSQMSSRARAIAAFNGTLKR